MIRHHTLMHWVQMTPFAGGGFSDGEMFIQRFTSDGKASVSPLLIGIVSTLVHYRKSNWM